MKRPFFALCIISWLAGCASEVYRTPVQFAPSTDQQPVLRVREPTTVPLLTGYSKLIKPGSKWRFVGTTPHGDVFRPIDDVFTIEGTNMHEAYLVVMEGYVVGFYLPGERAFSPLTSKIRLITE